jgi:hypothetical protein
MGAIIMSHFLKTAAALLALAAASFGFAFAEEARPAAAPEDVASIDAIMTAVYDVISGPAGEERDWDRFQSLFIDGARLIPRSASNPNGATVLSPEDYVARASGNFMENGFFESEIGRKTDRFGDIAQVFSAYQSKRAESDPEPFARGINSFQLLHHDGRWWIVTIYWQAETPETPIPAEYLAAQ